jgi:hypothetical protein
VRLPTPIARCLLWVVRLGARISRVPRLHRIDGLELVDLRSTTQSGAEQLSSLVAGAIADLRYAGFGEQIDAGLRTLVAFPSTEAAAPVLFAYCCPFDSRLQDRRGLACRLLWFAIHNAAHNAARRQGVAADPVSIGEACHRTQIAFVQHFPDGALWTELLERAHSEAR